MKELPYTASELLETGMCSATCLLAYAIGDECRCRCRGEFHGVLKSAQVSGGTSWIQPVMRHGEMMRHHLDALCPKVRDIRGFNSAYVEARRRGEAFAAVMPRDRRSELTVDLETSAYDAELPAKERDFLEEMMIRLMKADVMTGGTPGSSLINAQGLRSPLEAQVLGLIVKELYYQGLGRPTVAIECFSELDSE